MLLPWLYVGFGFWGLLGIIHGIVVIWEKCFMEKSITPQGIIADLALLSEAHEARIVAAFKLTQGMTLPKMQAAGVGAVKEFMRSTEDFLKWYGENHDVSYIGAQPDFESHPMTRFLLAYRNLKGGQA
jgi:hypothetical protein